MPNALRKLDKTARGQAGAPTGRDRMQALDAYLRELGKNRIKDWAWRNYRATVLDVARIADAERILEVGGGRAPMLSPEDTLGVEYTSNDISADELARAPDWLSVAHFDISTEDATLIQPYAERYDVVFSKMVMEHVPSFDSSWRNMHTLLRPGGISIHFHPVLFAFPFVVNKILPHELTEPIVVALNPGRSRKGRAPKFPAYYRGCFVSPRVRRRIQDIGFRQVWQLPFWGHSYYDRIPGGRSFVRFSAQRFSARDWTFFASFSYTIAIK